MADSTAKLCQRAQTFATAPIRPHQGLERNDYWASPAFRFSFLFGHDLFRPDFARRSIKQIKERLPVLRAGGKPVTTFRVMP